MESEARVIGRFEGLHCLRMRRADRSYVASCVALEGRRSTRLALTIYDKYYVISIDVESIKLPSYCDHLLRDILELTYYQVLIQRRSSGGFSAFEISKFGRTNFRATFFSPFTTPQCQYHRQRQSNGPSCSQLLRQRRETVPAQPLPPAYRGGSKV